MLSNPDPFWWALSWVVLFVSILVVLLCVIAWWPSRDRQVPAPRPDADLSAARAAQLAAVARAGSHSVGVRGVLDQEPGVGSPHVKGRRR